MKQGKYEMIRFDLYTPRIARDIIEIEVDKFNIPPRTYSRTRIFCIFIGAGESVILLEIARAEENSKTGRRWYDRVKYSVGYVIRNWWLPVFVWDIFFEMLMQV